MAKSINYYFLNTDAKSLNGDCRYPILIQGGFAATSGAAKYGRTLARLQPDDILLLYEKKYGVVAVGRVLERWNEKAYSTPKYYVRNKSFTKGVEHEYRIRVDWFLDLSGCAIPFSEVNRRTGSTPSATLKKIGKRAEVERMIAELRLQSFLPEEVSEPALYIEGASRQVSVNAYERNPEARRRCIERYGTNCCICGFSFGARYGEVAEGYIHVHHRRPLSEIGGEYVVDPVEDLRPVCPNCHAVLHRRIPAYSIEEVLGFLQR